MVVENIAAGWTIAKPCDLCKTASSVLFCPKDTLFLCISCDIKTHAHTKHERVWMCQVCEQVPASVTCKADAAALCDSCDRDIHSVNPLARRHERIPVIPFYDSSELLESVAGDVTNADTTSVDLHVQFPLDIPHVTVRGADMFSDRIFDFGFAIPSHVLLENEFNDTVTVTTDCVVPVPGVSLPPEPARVQIVDHKSLETRTPYMIDFKRSGSNQSNQSQSHSVSTSSIDAGAVTEESSILETVNNRVRINCDQNKKMLSAVDREARVLRYREKRKTRKFDKKIRYASRKAYAEMRPRVKGRFVKQTELTTDLDGDPWFGECGGGGELDQCGVLSAF